MNPLDNNKITKFVVMLGFPKLPMAPNSSIKTNIPCIVERYIKKCNVF